MTVIRWTGNGQTTYHIATITVANTWATGDTGTITINGKDLILTVGAVATTAGVAAALVAMFNGDAVVGTETRNNVGSNIPEFNEITAVLSGSTVVLTHDTAGVPFTATVAENTAGTGTLAIATTVSSTGPSFWSDAENWDTGAVPITGDDVYIDSSDQSITDGLAQSAVTLASLTIGQNYTGEIGRPKENPNGYPEYRADYLAISATSLISGIGVGGGSGRIKINLGTAQSTIQVLATGSSREQWLGAFIVKGTHASGTLEVVSGSVDVAAYGGEVATLLTVRNSGGRLRLGAGCTLTTVLANGGETAAYSAIVTCTITGGEVSFYGSGAITTATVSNGVLNYNSSGTLGTANVNRDGTIDCSADISARTFTTTTMDRDSSIRDPARTITYTNGIARGANATQIFVQ